MYNFSLINNKKKNKKLEFAPRAKSFYYFYINERKKKINKFS